MQHNSLASLDPPCSLLRPVKSALAAVALAHQQNANVEVLADAWQALLHSHQRSAALCAGFISKVVVQALENNEDNVAVAHGACVACPSAALASLWCLPSKGGCAKIRGPASLNMQRGDEGLLRWSWGYWSCCQQRCWLC